MAHNLGTLPRNLLGLVTSHILNRRGDTHLIFKSIYQCF